MSDSKMTLEIMKKLIENTSKPHKRFVEKADEAMRYYFCRNDILDIQLPGEDPNNPRRAMNRIPSNLFQLLVDQKVEYMFKIPPKPDTRRDKLNEDIRRVLTHDYPRIMQKVGKDASIMGRGIIHFWITGTRDMNTDGDEDGEFKYTWVDPREVVLRWGGTLGRELLGLKWTYEITDLDGKVWTVVDYFDKEFVYSYRKEKDDEDWRSLKPYMRYEYWNVHENKWDKTNKFKHGFDRVPFVIFKNNAEETGDLLPIKPFIDAYDKINSAFFDDVEEIQQSIFILKGYGAEPPDDFLNKLKQNRLVKLESNYPEASGLKPDLEVLGVEIPTDAYELSQKYLRSTIYEASGGMPNTDVDFNYTNSQALKHRYESLELKCNPMQNEFQNSLYIFFGEICKYLGTPIEEHELEIKWTRSKINDDTELMNNARLCFGFTSLRTALSVNPYVEDVDKELQYIEEDRKREMELYMPDMESVRQYSSSDDTKNGNQATDNLAARQRDQKDSERKSSTPEKYQEGSKLTTTK